MCRRLKNGTAQHLLQCNVDQEDTLSNKESTGDDLVPDWSDVPVDNDSEPKDAGEEHDG